MKKEYKKLNNRLKQRIRLHHQERGYIEGVLVFEDEETGAMQILTDDGSTVCVNKKYCKIIHCL